MATAGNESPALRMKAIGFVFISQNIHTVGCDRFSENIQPAGWYRADGTAGKVRESRREREAEQGWVFNHSSGMGEHCRHFLSFPKCADPQLA
jgi:hypothetical protein